jgi:hypothetical protein
MSGRRLAREKKKGEEGIGKLCWILFEKSREANKRAELEAVMMVDGRERERLRVQRRR